MTAKEYLGQIRLIDDRIKDLEAEYKSLTSVSSCSYSNTKVQTSVKCDIVGDKAVRRNEIARNIHNLLAEKYKIIDFIPTMIDPMIAYEVLYEKYVHHKKLGDIAKKIGYSNSYIRHIHTKALKELDKLVPDVA